MELCGGAGHSFEIAKKLEETGILIGIDKDEEALKASKEKLKDFSNIKYVHGNHDEIQETLSQFNIEKVDGILLDLGVSSYQLDEKNRGFSYMSQESLLDMRMDKTQELTAREVVNQYSEERLSQILLEYGEEKFAKKIAKNICERRKIKEIETTGELVEIIKKSIPAKFSKEGHPAKRTFQAIRIEVNNEIEPLYNTIMNSIKLLNKHGRLCVITFHSLEDRAVKKAFTDSVRKMYLSKRITILCMWSSKSWKNNNKKADNTNRRRTKRKFKSKKCKTSNFWKRIAKEKGGKIYGI